MCGRLLLWCFRSPECRPLPVCLPEMFASGRRPLVYSVGPAPQGRFPGSFLQLIFIFPIIWRQTHQTIDIIPNFSLLVKPSAPGKYRFFAGKAKVFLAFLDRKHRGRIWPCRGQLVEKACRSAGFFLWDVFSRTCAGKKHRNPPIFRKKSVKPARRPEPNCREKPSEAVFRQSRRGRIWPCRGAFGGNMWESNPPRQLFTTLTGFEDQGAHQHPSAPECESQYTIAFPKKQWEKAFFPSLRLFQKP